MIREPAFYIGRPIFSLQTMLRQISFRDPRVLPVIPNGTFGRNTYASVRSFQAAYGLPQTGRVDQTVWDAVAAAYEAALRDVFPPEVLPFWPVGQVLRPRAQNPDLYLAQAMLYVLSQRFRDLPTPTFSGTLDAATAKGLRWVQQAAGLPQNGSLDTQTWRILSSLYRGMTGPAAEPMF